MQPQDHRSEPFAPGACCRELPPMLVRRLGRAARPCSVNGRANSLAVRMLLGAPATRCRPRAESEPAVIAASLRVSVGIFAARDLAMPELSPDRHAKRVVHAKASPTSCGQTTLRVAVAVAIALGVSCGAAPPPCKLVERDAHAAPLLWRVQGPGGGSVWLYGTIHDAGAEDVPAVAWTLLDAAPVFVSELGDAEPDRALPGRRRRVHRGRARAPPRGHGARRDARASGLHRGASSRHAVADGGKRRAAHSTRKPTAQGRTFSPESTYTPPGVPGVAWAGAWSVSVTETPLLIMSLLNLGLISSRVSSE